MIETSYFWTVIFLLMVGTISIRGSLIAFSKKIKINERAKELFSFIPAAILPAFIVPSSFFHQGNVAFLDGKERLFILGVAAMVCLWTKSTLITILTGLIGLYLVTTYLI